MRRVKKIIAVIILFLIIAIGSFHVWLQDSYVVPIIMYHSVDNPRHLSGIVVSPSSFRQQMDFLKRNDYHVISLDALITAKREKRHLSKNNVIITFDDGYDDNYTYAFPVLKEYGFPASIFVITNLIGKPGYLTWEELKEMEKSQITIGSHTVDHVYLPGVPLDWQSYQIKESKRVLEEKLGHTIDFFAYPSGGFSDGTKDIVEAAGYRAALTTNRGNKRFNEDVYELKRVRFKDKDSSLGLWAKLSGFYNLFRVLKEPN